MKTAKNQESSRWPLGKIMSERSEFDFAVAGRFVDSLAVFERAVDFFASFFHQGKNEEETF